MFLDSSGDTRGEHGGNTWLYPDFPTMTTRIIDGYRRYQHYIKEALNLPVFILPCGEVFQRVWDIETEAKRNRFSSNSPFKLLFKDNGHPSPGCGSFAVALTMLLSFTGRRISEQVQEEIIRTDITKGAVSYYWERAFLFASVLGTHEGYATWLPSVLHTQCGSI